jgi:hypothetical protein
VPALARALTLVTDHTQRVYRRVFDHLKADLFVLTVRTQAYGEGAVAAEMERFIAEQLDKARADLGADIERADVLMDEVGLRAMPSYPEALSVQAEFTTPYANRFLMLLEQLDAFLTRLDALWLSGYVETRIRNERAYLWQRRLIRLAGRIRHNADIVRKPLRQSDGAGPAEGAGEGVALEQHEAEVGEAGGAGEALAPPATLALPAPVPARPSGAAERADAPSDRSDA